jgi:hypothetical protein
MSISNTLKQNNTVTTNLNQDNEAPAIAIPVRVELPKSPTQLSSQGKKSSLTHSQSLSATDELKIRDTLNLAGIRPIAASDLEIRETVNLAGVRPIASSELQVSQIMSLMGNRPIASSNLQFSTTILTSGIRPIASNEIEDSGYLMGYLD